jgi:hypothetical protein
VKYFLSLNVILLSISQFATAQSPIDPAAMVQSRENQSSALAATWLGSSDPRTRAWGAYLALRDRRAELLPHLIGLAEAYPFKGGQLNPTERDDHDAMLSVLDALIQMDGTVPPEVAAKLYPEFPVQALLLLRGRPAASNVLLDIFREDDRQMAKAVLSAPQPLIFWSTSARTSSITMSPGTVGTLAWLAAGDLLLMSPRKPPGFAAIVFGGLMVDTRVRVIDGGSGPAALGAGIGGSCANGGGPSPRPGWPQVGNYFFADYAHTFLAGGPDRSFYARRVSGPDSTAGQFACGFMRSPDVLREHFLASLAGDDPENPTVRSSIQTTIMWQNDQQYLRDLRTLVDQQQSQFETLGKKLMDAGVISEEERASLRPSLQVRISDERSQKRSGLPIVPYAGSNVKIVNQPATFN